MGRRRKLSESVKARVLEEAYYTIRFDATIRETAVAFDISKSTVYNDLSDKLIDIDPIAAAAVRTVFERHKSERARNGGLASAENRRWRNLLTDETKRIIEKYIENDIKALKEVTKNTWLH